MSRGDQRDDIFLGDVDRHDFIKTLAVARQKVSALEQEVYIIIDSRLFRP